MAMAAGKRDRKVTFYPVTSGEDTLGVESETRGTGVKAMANVLYGAGSERREAGQAGSQQSATFRVLSTSRLRALTERCEIVDDHGATWGVTSIVPVGIHQSELEFTAIKNGA